MKRYIFFTVITIALGTTDSFAQGKLLKDSSKAEDAVEFYEVEIEGRQKNYKELLVGQWSIDTMRSQARAKPDALSSVVLSFQSDSTFSISSNCSNVSGTYRLKGTGISFSITDAPKISCEHPDQDILMQKLLMQRVSAYSVENNILLLRDGSSNVVFRTSRKRS